MEINNFQQPVNQTNVTKGIDPGELADALTEVTAALIEQAENNKKKG